jgi:hypothetical protein
MKTPLSVALHEGHGFLQDQGWHQTAHLMTVAAQEIERLSERVRELEKSQPDRTRIALARPTISPSR